MVCIDVLGWVTTNLGMASFQFSECAVFLALNIKLHLAIRRRVKRETIEAFVFDFIFVNQ
jgi:hypothetical protein